MSNPGPRPRRRDLVSKDTAGPLAGSWQGSSTCPTSQPHEGSFPRWFLSHRELGFSQCQLPGIRRAPQAVTGTALLGSNRAVWQQRAVPRHRDTCQPSPCGTHRTPSGPGVAGTVPWPRGTEQVCRAALAVPLICSNPVCTRGGASPDWPQGQKCPVAEAAPSVAEGPHSCQAHRDGLSPPSCHPFLARTGAGRVRGALAGNGGPRAARNIGEPFAPGVPRWCQAPRARTSRFGSTGAASPGRGSVLRSSLALPWGR